VEVGTEKQESSPIAYVFPGQGAQFVGMGLELYRSSKAAKDVFDQVDEILATSLTKLIFDGPEEELERTINSQPAIMATSLACLKAMDEFQQSDTYQPVAMAGHSLGEYSSLVASGVLDLADGIRLVRERGRLMQEASDTFPGSMAAIIGLEQLTIEEICMETGAQIANVNNDDQIVISGDRMCVARALDMSSMRGAKRAIPLPVSGAFHSTLMSSAQEGLAAAIQEVKFRDPVSPIIANSTSAPLTTAEEVRDELLAQLCSCVQWKKSVGCMLSLGVSGFIEFGPGRVLAGLIKRISHTPMYQDRQVEILNVADLASARTAAETSLRWGSSAPLHSF
jgi:[acyl-carrier-protein] S-malonyltransferase